MVAITFSNNYVLYDIYGNEIQEDLGGKYAGLIIYDESRNKFTDVIDHTHYNKTNGTASSLSTHTGSVVIYGISQGNYFNEIKNDMVYAGSTLSFDTVVGVTQPAPLYTIISKVGYLKYSNNTWYSSISWNLNGNVHTLKINNKEVLQIKRNSDNKVLYQH